jgi:hypothetical protein
VPDGWVGVCPTLVPDSRALITGRIDGTSRFAALSGVTGKSPRIERTLWSPLALLSQQSSREVCVILFLVILLVVFWLLGMVTTYTLGGWLHILLVIAVIFLLIRLIRGEPV